MPTPPVNTKQAKRRVVRYSTIDELLADVERLAAAERSGRLERSGNWTLGQALGHIAGWANTPYDGYPPNMPKPPWLIKVIMKAMKGRILTKGFPAGVRMRGVEAGSLFTEPLALEEGVRRIRSAMERVRTTQPVHTNAIFGPMSREEVEQMQLRHAELHLSFMHAS